MEPSAAVLLFIQLGSRWLRSLAPEGERFAGHLAFYPGAFMWPEEMRWSNPPILTLIGAEDDYTPASLIEELSLAINEMEDVVK